VGDNGLPNVRIGGEPVAVLRASADELLVAPLSHQMAGVLEVLPSPQTRATLNFDLRPYWGESETVA